MRIFSAKNPDLPDDFYGRWISSKPVNTSKCPDIADYKLPTSQVEWDMMLAKVEELGIDREIGIQAIRKRKDEFIKALNEYKRINNSTSNDEH